MSNSNLLYILPQNVRLNTNPFNGLDPKNFCVLQNGSNYQNSYINPVNIIVVHSNPQIPETNTNINNVHIATNNTNISPQYNSTVKHEKPWEISNSQSTNHFQQPQTKIKQEKQENSFPVTIHNNIFNISNRIKYNNGVESISQNTQEEYFLTYKKPGERSNTKDVISSKRMVGISNTNTASDSDEYVQLYKGYSYKKELLKSGNSIKIWKCPECKPSRHYKSLKCLKSHFKVHSDAAYKCKLCSFKSARPKQLEDHLRVHTGERPFECDICSKRFKHKHTLSAHKLIHSSLKPHSCRLCNKRFRVKHNLAKHMAIHNPNRNTYSCDCCKKVLKSLEGIRGHIARYHSKHNGSYTVL